MLTVQRSSLWTSSHSVHRAKICRLPENRKEYMTGKGVACSLKPLELSEKCEGHQQISILDLPYGKMFQEHLAATEEKTSEQYCKPSAMSAKKDGFLFLNLKGDGGNLLGLSWEMVSALPGVYTMLNFGEFPSEERGSTLSQILELNAPEKYFLSQRACAGILRRAENRGKELPSMLKDALMEVVGSDG